MVVKIIGLLFSAILLYMGFYFIVPDVSKLKKENPGKTSFMKFREREGEERGKRVRIRQQWVPLTRISPYVIKAVLIAEDDKFWSHEGFDFEAIQKALEKDLKARKFKLGGSTISQQLAKNLYLTPSKNLLRKGKEAILTWRIERNLTKKRIIELYLNLVEWGEGVFGIEAAARYYFGKSAAALGPEEAARLAVILPNPRKLKPVGNSGYVDRRAGVIYNIMVKRGIVIPEYEKVMAPEKEAEHGNLGPINPKEQGNQDLLPPDSSPSIEVGGKNNPDSNN
ncbi:MAG: monofunctional biosynthetic peptidoglycan transglycosylase [Deltaproteobacteria bacterium]|nr:monofunctional biosynthetic peptidoglycan transglycosylase [Deltaproteobacteria bacterium]